MSPTFFSHRDPKNERECDGDFEIFFPEKKIEKYPVRPCGHTVT